MVATMMLEWMIPGGRIERFWGTIPLKQTDESDAKWTAEIKDEYEQMEITAEYEDLSRTNMIWRVDHRRKGQKRRKAKGKIEGKAGARPVPGATTTEATDFHVTHKLTFHTND
jgi:hypothetical protein